MFEQHQLGRNIGGAKKVMGVLAAAGAAALALGASLGAGQPSHGLGRSKSHSSSTNPTTNPSTPPASTPGAPTSFLDDVLKKGHTHDWVLRVSLHLDSYQDPNVYVLPTTPKQVLPSSPGIGPSGSMPTIIPFKFDTAAVVFPVIKETATSKLDGDVTAKMVVDGRDVTGEPTWIEGLPSGARYGRWDMKSVEGRTIDFDVTIPVTTWEVLFDEHKASKAVWPQAGKWSQAASTSLGAITMGSGQGELQFVDPNSPGVRGALSKWTDGKPPQSIPPVQLAKFLMGKVVEAIQPSGDGLISSRTGLLEGFALKTPDQTLTDGTGSEHDIACLLCSVYRAAGLPARLVIGYDVSETKQGQDSGLKHRKSSGGLRSWVEFCLVDETVTMPSGGPKELWVPADPMRQRKFSNRVPPLDRPWRYFGSNEDTDDVVPIAFNYHPPLTGVIAHGSPCFWGWMTTPEMQQAEQMLRFMVITAPKTAPTPGGGTK